MGKRSSFDREPRDLYKTPYAGVLPLLPYLQPKTRFIEPCAGDGRLVRHLERHGHVCVSATDIEPLAENIGRQDMMTVKPVRGATHFITNPPWDRKLLHPLIPYLGLRLPTWLLFDADWAHTKQSAPFMPYCHRIISVGRLKWFEDSTMTGKDSCSWYMFDYSREAETIFTGRAA